MLRVRILAAIPIMGFTIICLWYDSRHGTGWGLAASMACFTVLALREFYAMTRTAGFHPYSRFAVPMGAVLVFGHERWCLEKYHGLERLNPDLMSTLVAFVVLGCFLMPVLRRKPEGALGDIGSTLLGLIYIWLLPSFIMRLRHLGVPGADGWRMDGIELVAVCILVAKCSDVGGYIFGSMYGKRKLCPTISPKKSWEGLIGGVALSVATICLVALGTPYGAVAALGWAKVVALGVVLALSGLLGDLVESVFKRDAEVKDAGSSVPGFGGFLDVVDSLMVSAPAMYYFMILCGGAAPGLEN